MLLEPECMSCLINQIYKAFTLLNPSISKQKIVETQIKLMEYLTKVNLTAGTDSLVGAKTYELVSEALGDKDPYKSLKLKYNKLAMEYYDIVEENVNNAEDSVFEAIAVSAIGNTIDFGSNHEMDFINDIKNFTPENFAINDIPEFKKSLANADNNGEKILVLLDNAGEIVFDKVLVITLKKLYPNIEIICTVRSGPIINDATIEDAKFVGLTEVTKVIEAPAAPGIELSIASEEFKKYFYADNVKIILSKGQGNFESLYGLDIPHKDVFYLLKAKCGLMEKIFNVKIGDLIFKKKNSNF